MAIDGFRLMWVGSRRAAPALAAALVLFLAGPRAGAQVGPVYPDDSVSAREGLARAAELAAGGNLPEAARVVQSVLNTAGDSVIEADGETDLFVSVRSRAHRLLLSTPALLARYRANEEASAAAALASGRVEDAERQRLLTRSGFEAALRVAEAQIEAAKFEPARLTLTQLEVHPDRVGPSRDSRAAEGAATVLSALARYLDREEIRVWAARWSAEANLAPEGAGIRTIPAPPVAGMLSPFSAYDGPQTDGLVSQPLQSVWMSTAAEEDALDAARAAESGRRRFMRESPDEPWVFPTIVGDAVYTNDGRTIAAWDRFTLQPVWQFTPDEMVSGAVVDPSNRAAIYRPGRTILEDSSSVAVAGGVVVAATGLSTAGSREGDARIHALDAATGAVMWSVSPAVQNPALSTAFVRGPVVIDGDTAVVLMRKPSQVRRMAGAYLVSLDLWTGRVRWVRLLGSAGAMFATRARIADVPVVHRGVIYASDDLGVMAAVEADTGRAVWVRRFRSDLAPRNEWVPPWSSASPLIDGDTMIAIAPTKDQVIRVALASGEIVGHRRASDLGGPLYLVRVGPWLASVAYDGVLVTPVDGFERATPRMIGLPADVRMHGRSVGAVTPGGVRLAIPLVGGLALADPADPGSVVRVPLAFSGNFAAIGAHVVVASSGKLHSYLVWDAAESLLRERMRTDPADPRAALALMDLAYRSGRAGLVPAAADAALAAVALGPERLALERTAVFESLRSMAQSTLETFPSADPRGLPETGAGSAARIIDDPRVLEAVIERLGKAAQSPSERAEWLMTLGKLDDRRASESLATAARAAEAYQRIVSDETIASATWRGPRQAVRAEIEATQRLRDLIKRAGRAAYAVPDRQAADALAATDLGAPGETFEALARRFPVSGSAPEFWLRAASSYERAGKAPAALSALGHGLRAAEWAISVGDASQSRALGEAAGRLVRALERTDQTAAAAQTLEKLAREYPGIVLTVDGAPLDIPGWADTLRERLAGAGRRPRVGSTIDGPVQTVDGWSLVRPMSQTGGSRATEHVVLHSRERREIALFGSAADGTLKPVWARGYRGDRVPALIALNSTSAYVFWPSEAGGSLERIDAVGGQTRWRTPDFGDLFPPGEMPDAGADFISPLDGRVRAVDLLATMDEQTAVLVERRGRLAAFDLASGRTLWTTATGVQQVFDAAVGPGAGAGPGQNVVVLGGAGERARALGEAGALEPTVAAFDLRTGRLMHQMRALGGEVSWVRTTGEGDVIVGLEHKVVSLNLAGSAIRWEISDSAAKSTRAAWVFGDRLYVQTPSGSRNVWTASVRDGRRREALLDAAGRLDDDPVRAMPIGAGEGAKALFVSRRGAVIFNSAGERIGLDSLGGAVDLLPPELAEQVIVTVETGRTPSPAGQAATVHVMDTLSGKLLASRGVVVHEEPRELALLDGRVLVSTDSVTLVVPAR